MEALTLRFAADSEWDGELSAAVSVRGFSGMGRAWFNHETIRQFARELNLYPLSAESAPTIEGGVSKSDGTIGIRVGISVRPYNLRGTLLVSVVLDGENYAHDLPCAIKAEFFTSYSELKAFADELIALVEGQIETATLNARSLY